MRSLPLTIVVVTVLIGNDLPRASAQVAASPRALEFRFTPTARAQIAIWIEKADGTFVKTIALTQATAFRGIGNRPGAYAMNSGFHWPYGRREGTLPVWAHRRAGMAGAKQFKRVIFQNRTSEGFASRTSEDSTPESYFCLAFMAPNAPLDAVSCASGFFSDKGRFIRDADVAKGYSEPLDSSRRPLDLVSLYPPRRDITRCSTSGCVDTPDTSLYNDHARDVMPDIDSVTMATPGGKMEQSLLFPVPDEWTNGNYVAWAEVNTEDDSNPSYRFETPKGDDWDSWAETFGYSYRGQPSVVFSVPVTVGTAGTYDTSQPSGYGSVTGFGTDGGAVHALDGTITNDPAGAPGSGADRFRLMPGKDYRLRVSVRGGDAMGGMGGMGGGSGAGGTAGSGPTDTCRTPPSVPGALAVAPSADAKHSHEWGHLHFLVPESAQQIHHYEVRVSKSPITADDPKTFEQGLPANAASLDSEELVVPTTGLPGSSTDVDFGQLQPRQTYWVGVRAVNGCAVYGPYAVGSFTTTAINFTKLSGCFVATAAFGSPLEPQVESLRRVRDAMRKESAVFAAATDLYYRSGPPAAALISRSDVARAVVRTLLGPIVEVAGAAQPVAADRRHARPAVPAGR